LEVEGMMKQVCKKKTGIILAVCLILAVGAFVAFRLPQKQSDVPVVAYTGIDFEKVKKMSLSAVSSDKAGVDLDSAFILKSELPVKEDDIYSSLTVNSERNYDLKKVSDTEFQVSMKTTMVADRVYKFEMKGSNPNEKYSWAFQTQKPFRILRSLPRDKATDVPVDTGIEITLSYEDAEDFESHFQIEPPVPGRFEKHKKTVVFIPQNGLEYAKVYRITVTKGIKLAGSDTVTENDVSFAFQTRMTPPKNEEDYSYFSVWGNEFFTTSMKPVFIADTSDNIMEGDISVNVYKISDAESFAASRKPAAVSGEDWAKAEDTSDKRDVSGFNEVLSFRTKLAQPEEYFYDRGLLNFPEALQEGYYLAKVSAGGEMEWVYFQVNDIVSYINVSENKLLFWVNDALTHASVEGAVIESKVLPESLKTDSAGIAAYDRSTVYAESNELIFKISVPGHETLLTEVDFYASSKEDRLSREKSLSYMNYLYLDRSVYLPDDKIQFFGILKPRKEGEKVENVRVTLTHDAYYYEDSEEDSEDLDTVDIQVSKTGTFSGELDVKGVDEGYLYVNLLVDGVEICSEETLVGKYEKPSYTLSVEADKERMFAWDSVSFEASASFYEGIPANGMKLKYEVNGPSYSEVVQEGELLCDANGKIKIDASFDKMSTGSWRPYSAKITVSNALAEVQEIRAAEYVEVYPSDTMLNLDTKVEGQVCQVDVEANGVLLDRPEYTSIDDYRGAPVDRTFKAVVKEVHNNRIEDGEEYDYVNKKSIPQYRYEKVESIMKEFDFNTVDGKYRFDFPYVGGEETDRGYIIVISGLDSRGTCIEEDKTILPYYEVMDAKAENDSGELAAKYYNLVRVKSREDDTVNPGELVNYTLQLDEKEIAPNPEAKCLYLLIKGGILEYSVSDKPQYSFTFKEEYIPNAYVKAVYFDGSLFYPMEQDEVRYNTKPRELKIEARLDKEEYKPGDNVTVDFKVSDAAGNPVGADINVSIVEEVLFQEHDQYGEVLSRLYGFSDPDGIYADFCSHTYLDAWYDHHRGYGGRYGETPMIDHMDTALFKTVEIDESGMGQASFTLPDTHTKWRMSYQGYNTGNLGGQGKINFTTKVPFIADVLCSDTYMSGDSMDVVMRVFGTDMALGEEVRYEVSMEDPQGVKKESTVVGKTGEYAYLTVDKLTQGTYKISVTASYKEYTYIQQREIGVHDYLLETSRVDYKTLADGMTFTGSPNSKTKLIFYNNSGSLFYDELISLSFAWGERIDQKLSRLMAQELLKKYFNDTSRDSEDGNTLLHYQQEQGGISLLNYGDADPELTARICAVSVDRFDKVKLAQYFYDILENKESMPEEVASAYWGLASAGESVLLEVQGLFEAEEFKGKPKLYLALALAELGDFKTALGYLNRLISEKGKQMSPMLYIEEGVDRDDYLEYTALCAVLSIKTLSPDRIALHNYVKSNRSGELLLNLERLIYLSELIPDVTTSGKFKYSLNGKEKQVTLEKSDTYSLELSPEELGKLQVSGVEGDIVAVERYIGSVADMTDKSSDQIAIWRRYEVIGSVTAAFRQSDYVKVVLTPTFTEGAPDGLYEITDVLPAGFKYMSRCDSYDRDAWYPSDNTGQRVTFDYYYRKSDKGEAQREIVYYARVLLPGQFTADYCAMRQYDTMETAFAERKPVVVER
jgi:alpha-2-macroglobulin